MASKASRIVVLAAIVAGIIGSGAGRADAAVPTKVTRSAGKFKASIEVYLKFGCRDLPDAGTKSVTATAGTTNIGASQTFTCVNPANANEKLVLRYSLINIYSSAHVSNATHQFSMSYTPDGRTFYTCLNWTRGSNFGGVLTQPVPTQWHDGNWALGHRDCADGTPVDGGVFFSEAWSAS